ncbi:MAG: DUF2330 domain-containing protein [Planctomycetota bacterium]|jgi:hypothetical protein
MKSETMQGKWFLYIVHYILLAACSVVYADRGAIVSLGDVNVEEPAQRALIAHDGVKQILILQTDIKANKTTKIVEFMPLPTKPEVSLAPEECFSVLQQIIKTHKLKYVIYSRGKGDDKSEPVKLVVSEQLGPHKVSVVEVNDANSFVKWVSDFFEENGLGKPKLGNQLHNIVVDYLKRDIKFFAFDIVTVSAEKKTVRPLVYRFKSPELYYPLKVTNLYGGRGTIELLVILPKDLYASLLWISASSQVREHTDTSRACMGSTFAELNAGDLERIDPSIAKLMERKSAILQAVKYEGPLSFDEDLNAYLSYGTKQALTRRFFETLQSGNIERLDTLVSVPFAFDRKKVIYKKTELRKSFLEVLNKTRGKPLRVEEISCVFDPDYTLVDDFNREFVEKNHLRRADHFIVATVEGEKVLLFARQMDYGSYKIVGFSDLLNIVQQKGRSP